MSAIDRRFYLSQQVWAMLALAVAEGRTMTYKEVGDKIGVIPVRMSQILSPIKEYCKHHGLPHLNAVCVNADTQLPSDPEYGSEALRFLEAARAYDWSKQPVCPRDFALAHKLAEAERQDR